MKDIRYLQRFENYEKSFLLLSGALEINAPSLVEKAETIQFFETTFELAWKLMKDYLSYLGYEVKSPRDAIKQSFAIELITNGDSWINALMDRNLITHTYDEEIANEVYQAIKNNYFLLLDDLYIAFKEQICLD